MKTLKTISVLAIIICLFFYADYNLGKINGAEIGIVAHKTLAPPGTYAGMAVDDIMHVLVVVQTDKQRGYYIAVPRDYFYDIERGDRVPLRKRYGWITGHEYEQAIVYNGD